MKDSDHLRGHEVLDGPPLHRGVAQAVPLDLCEENPGGCGLAHEPGLQRADSATGEAGRGPRASPHELDELVQVTSLGSLGHGA